ncbi:hypothetical protein [Streptomyces sp. NPDC056491]|uniref:hypothetical protein n=1 Tax=Streptomyces sp. NPDC056491 TaxID=3345837 RepID=UPI00369C1F94
MASTRGLDIGDVTQHEVDARLWDNPGTRDEVRDFIVRAHRRGHSRALGVPHRPKTDPVELDEDSHGEALHHRPTHAELHPDVMPFGLGRQNKPCRGRDSGRGLGANGTMAP